MKLLFLSLLFTGGVCLGRFVSLPLWVLPLGLLPFFLAVRKNWRLRAAYLGVGTLLLVGGAVYYPVSVPGQGPDTLSYYNGRQEVSVTGVVSREVERRDTTQQLRVSVSKIDLAGHAESIGGDMLVFVPRFPQYSYGDEIVLTGKLENPPVFRDELTGEIEFDYADYLALQNVYSVMVYPRIEVTAQDNGNPVLAWLYNLRQDLSLSIEKAMPEPQASLGRGMLLGMRYDIPQDIRDSFSATGTYHLLAISGLHLSIIAGMVLSLCLALFGRRRYWYVWMTMGFVWVYVFISGAGTPVIRAAIMASVFLLAELFGRQKNALGALGLAAAVMAAIDPKVLFTPSFQMSFAAMAGIIGIYPYLRNFFRRFTVKLESYSKTTRFANAVTDSLAVSLAATIAVSPLVAYYFQIFSPLGPLLTLITLPAVAVVIVSAGLASLFGLVFWPVGAAIGSVAWLAGGYMIKIISWASDWSFGHGQPIDVSPVPVTIYYLVLAAIFLLGSRPYILRGLSDRLNLSGSRRWQSGAVRLSSIGLTAVVLVVLVTGGFLASCRHDVYLKISFLDVGQGDAILVSAGNQQVLIDGGPSPQVLANRLGEVMPFWDRTIEMVVLTHPHADHLNGLVEVLERYRVGRVMYSNATEGTWGSELSTLEKWQELVAENNIAQTIAACGQTFHLGEAVFTVLNPPAGAWTGTESDIDNNSIVLNLEAGDFNFLFTGDLMWQGELGLVLDRQLEPGSILKAGHHGSDTSSSPEFISVLEPGLDVICVGDNDYGQPNQEVLKRLEEFTGQKALRTDELGTITLLTDGRRLFLQTG